MNEHKYSKKYKTNVNLPYAKVGLRVFSSLFEAETYCTTHDFDVDNAIEYGDSEELKSEVQKIAIIQKAVLRGILEALDSHSKKISIELEQAVKARDNAEKNRDLLFGYYKEKVNGIIEKNSGVYEAREIVWKVLEELEKITGWKG